MHPTNVTLTKKLSIFQFSDPALYLLAVYEEKKRHNPRLSITRWAKHLGITSPTTLWRILSGKRKIGMATAKRIVAKLELGNEERKFFEVLIVAQQLGVNPSEFRRLLKPSHKDLPYLDISEGRFRWISEWYYWAILEMTALSGF